MVVTVITMLVVQASIDQVVEVVAVQDQSVTAARAVTVAGIRAVVGAARVAATVAGGVGGGVMAHDSVLSGVAVARRSTGAGASKPG